MAELERAELDGHDSDRVHALRDELAERHRRAGRLDEAADLDRRTLADEAAELGVHSPRLQRARDAEAQAAFDAGRYAEALGLHEANLAYRAEWYGHEHPQTLLSYLGAARCHSRLGHRAESEALLAHTLTALARNRSLAPDVRAAVEAAVAGVRDELGPPHEPGDA